MTTNMHKIKQTVGPLSEPTYAGALEHQTAQPMTNMHKTFEETCISIPPI